VTFHGPGQIVGYPIFNILDMQPKLGAVDFVRRLEEVLIRTCAIFLLPTRLSSRAEGDCRFTREHTCFLRRGVERNCRL